MMEDEKKTLAKVETIPVLPLFGSVIFPGMVAPVAVVTEDSISAVEKAVSAKRLIFCVLRRGESLEYPRPEELHSIGTVCFIAKVARMPGEPLRILLQGIRRAKIIRVVEPQPPYTAEIEPIEDRKIVSLETEALMRAVKDQFGGYLSLLPIPIIPEAISFLRTIDNPGKLADLVATNLQLKPQEAQEFLETLDPTERLRKISALLVRETEVLKVQNEIAAKVRENMEKIQKQQLLREQLKVIKGELGELEGTGRDIDELKDKVERSNMPDYAKGEVLRQIKRLEVMHPEFAEAQVIRTWIDEVLALPWGAKTRDNLDVKRARQILDEDHWDLEDVKERILEFLGVSKLRGEAGKGPILCFVGPPGVGKTSLGKSIARALGRKFVRISLGGLRDEAEIRGHRRTYVGAMPGRIMQGVKQAGSQNPVFMLDEIDKLASDFRGDPAAALLEVLDVEQNKEFVDHYINMPFNLSAVLFICTANITETIPPALLDRMEVIRIPGYTEYDKIKIAKAFFIKKAFGEAGIEPSSISLSDEAISEIIRKYTREAGLRELERKIHAVARKIALKIAEGDGEVKVRKTDIEKYLGPPEYPEIEKEIAPEVGIATGLAWTPSGGDVMKIETQVVKGSGGLYLTGSLGEVMKESARAALTYAKVHAEKFGIDPETFGKSDIHIHVPEGAVRKDGPSAGVTITCALISALSGKQVRGDVATTGEITLRGKVLPVGGIREKILAASRYGIKEVIIPEANKKDVVKLPKDVVKALKIHYAKTLDDVIKFVF